MKHLAQTEKAFEPIRRWLASAEQGADYSIPRVEAYRDGTGDFTTARLRLDWEAPSLVYDMNDDVADTMTKFVVNDVADLIEHGDVDKSEYVLYKTIDGSVKRGREPVNIEVLSARVFWELKPRKNTTEFTLYLLVAVDWQADAGEYVKRRFN